MLSLLSFFSKSSEDEKLARKFLKIADKLLNQSYYDPQHPREKVITVSVEEHEFFLSNLPSHGKNESKVINLSRKFIKKIHNFQKCPEYSTKEIQIAKYAKKTCTWQELRFVVFENIVHLFDFHCKLGEQVNFTEENPRYFRELIRTLVQNNTWFECLKSIDFENHFMKERWAIVMFILIRWLKVKDIILQTIWLNDKIKIPIMDCIIKHVKIANIDDHANRFYILHNVCKNKQPNITDYLYERAQIQLFGRYIDSSLCQMIHFNSCDEKIDNQALIQRHHFRLLFQKERLHYEEMILVQMAQLLELLDSFQPKIGQQFLIFELNQIIIAFCFSRETIC